MAAVAATAAQEGTVFDKVFANVAAKVEGGAFGAAGARGVDLVKEVMREVEEHNIPGRSKSVVVTRVLQGLMESRAEAMPEGVAKDLASMFAADLLQPIMDFGVAAGKGLLLHMHERGTCPGFTSLFKSCMKP